MHETDYPHVSFTELEFYDLPACKYETKILPFIYTFYTTHFCNQFNQLFALLTFLALHVLKQWFLSK